MVIYKLLEPLEVGYEVDTSLKAHSFVFCEHVTVVSGQYSRKIWPLRKKEWHPSWVTFYIFDAIWTSEDN